MTAGEAAKGARLAATRWYAAAARCRVTGDKIGAQECVKNALLAMARGYKN